MGNNNIQTSLENNDYTADNVKKDELNEKENMPKSFIKQMSCAAVINLVSLLQGASLATSSVILHCIQREDETSSSPLNDFSISQNDSSLLEDNSYVLQDKQCKIPFSIFKPFTVSQMEGSWVASSWVLSHLISACFAGILNDKIGRKKSLLIDTFVFFMGFAFLAASRRMICLVIARLLLGYPLVSQVFLSEIVSPNRRGIGAAMYSVMHSTGFFLILFLGAFLPWRYTMLVPAVLAFPIFLSICLLKDSPEWLLKNGHEIEYREALKFYQLQPVKDERYFNDNLQIDDKEPNANLYLEVNQHLETSKVHKSIWKIRSWLSKSIKSILRPFYQNPEFFSTFLYLAITFLCLGFVGFSILSCHAVEVFKRTGSLFSASNTAWITSIAKIVCAIFSFYILHKFNRISLFLSTCILIFLAFLTMGIYTFLSNSGVLEGYSSLNIIPMVCVSVAYIGYGLGYSVIPSLLAAELAPVEVRSTMTGILTTLEMISTFSLSILKPFLVKTIGIHGLFFMFSGAVLVVFILTAIIMPKSRYNKKISKETLSEEKI